MQTASVGNVFADPATKETATNATVSHHFHTHSLHYFSHNFIFPNFYDFSVLMSAASICAIGLCLKLSSISSSDLSAVFFWRCLKSQVWILKIFLHLQFWISTSTWGTSHCRLEIQMLVPVFSEWCIVQILMIYDKQATWWPTLYQMMAQSVPE